MCIQFVFLLLFSSQGVPVAPPSGNLERLPNKKQLSFPEDERREGMSGNEVGEGYVFMDMGRSSSLPETERPEIGWCVPDTLRLDVWCERRHFGSSITLRLQELFAQKSPCDLFSLQHLALNQTHIRNTTAAKYLHICGFCAMCVLLSQRRNE